MKRSRSEKKGNDVFVSDNKEERNGDVLALNNSRRRCS